MVCHQSKSLSQSLDVMQRNGQETPKFIKRRMVFEEHFNRAFHLVAELNAVEVIWANECGEIGVRVSFARRAKVWIRA